MSKIIFDREIREKAKTKLTALVAIGITDVVTKQEFHTFGHGLSMPDATKLNAFCLWVLRGTSPKEAYSKVYESSPIEEGER